MDVIDLSIEEDLSLLKTIIKPGSSDAGPSEGDTVHVHYIGTLTKDGTKFDSSRDRFQPFKFVLGKGEVIKGWDIGVKSMKEGEISNLRCATKYAYGKTGSPPEIPPNATLNFEIELLKWDKKK